MTKTTSFQPVKAYHSRKFLESPDARPIRILAEYLEPLERFEDERQAVAIAHSIVERVGALRIDRVGSVTVSAGVATYPTQGAGRDELLAGLRRQAKAEGLWALGHPKELGGGGLPFLDYVYVNEVQGRSEFGQLALGTWQGVYLCEHRDRPAGRRVLATLWGELRS